MVKFESEAHLEKFLLENKDEDKVKEALGLDGWDYAKINNQIRLGKYGVADMIAFCVDFEEAGQSEAVEIRVIELKNRPLEVKDIAQVGRYRRALMREWDESKKIKCTLLGTGVNQNSVDWGPLISQIDWLDVVVFDVDPLEGVQFQHETDYYHTDSGFTFDDVGKAIFGVEGE
jgi:hypothetical protein